MTPEQRKAARERASQVFARIACGKGKKGDLTELAVSAGQEAEVALLRPAAELTWARQVGATPRHPDWDSWEGWRKEAFLKGYCITRVYTEADPMRWTEAQNDRVGEKCRRAFGHDGDHRFTGDFE